MLESSLAAIEVAGPVVRDGVHPSAEVQKMGLAEAVGHTCPTHGLLRVLVVDDDKDTADSLSTLVGLWGHDVRVAYRAAAALEIASVYWPDVLLLDMAMPQMGGCALATQLRLQGDCKGALLIAVTGWADEAHRLLCERAGFDHFLAKPAAPEVIEALLHRACERLAQGPARHQSYSISAVDDQA